MLFEPENFTEINKDDWTKIETIPNRGGVRKQIQLVFPEFTSCCPKTGYPDFARLVIRYIPNQHIAELKSIKLFLGDFYGVGIFHEDAMQVIADEFARVIVPIWFSIVCVWNARGGVHTTTRLVWNDKHGYHSLPDHWGEENFVSHSKEWNNR